MDLSENNLFLQYHIQVETAVFIIAKIHLNKKNNIIYKNRNKI